MRKVALIFIIVLGVGFLAVNQKNSDYRKASFNKTKTQENLKKPTSFSIVLNQQNGSGQSGLATIEAKNDVVNIKIRIVGFNPNVSQPANIRTGICENPGEKKFNIVPLVEGESDTNIIATWDELSSMLPLILNIHKSEVEKNVYTSCGQVSP